MPQASQGFSELGDSEVRAEQGILIAELKFLIIDVEEMGLDESTAEIVIDKARAMLTKLDDSLTGKELDRIRVELGRLQAVVHQAVLRQKK